MKTAPEDFRAAVLVVDDELGVCKSCQKIIKRRGHDVSYVTSGREALKLLGRKEFDVVVTDLKMVDLGGMEVLRFVKENLPLVSVVVISGYATISAAVETMRVGAVDFLPKPFTAAELTATLNRAIEKTLDLKAAASLAAQEPPTDDFAGIVGKSAAMREVYSLIRKVSPTTSTVLILGESGTGKEVVAGAIHRLSERSGGRFVSVDCGALAPGLVESELFGHEKGAFTGSVGEKEGLFELADRGTIFLDEIGNIEPHIQAKLLRVIQEKEFMRVGGTTPKKLDLRMIFATNRDLKRMVADGTFREDLFYRLDVFPVRLPPLRERKSDIPALCFHFLKGFNAERAGKKRIDGIADEVLERLKAYDWPGNVRELANKVEQMAIMAAGAEITLESLPVSLYSGIEVSPKGMPASTEELKEAKKTLRETAVRQLEMEFVINALRDSDGNITRAAEAVGMKRQNFQSMMKKHGIQPDSFLPEK